VYRYAELHRYTLNYYLADGTVEVLESLGGAVRVECN
jgi:hypothetical protein